MTISELHGLISAILLHDPSAGNNEVVFELPPHLHDAKLILARYEVRVKARIAEQDAQIAKLQAVADAARDMRDAPIEDDYEDAWRLCLAALAALESAQASDYGTHRTVRRVEMEPAQEVQP